MNHPYLDMLGHDVAIRWQDSRGQPQDAVGVLSRITISLAGVVLSLSSGFEIWADARAFTITLIEEDS